MLGDDPIVTRNDAACAGRFQDHDLPRRLLISPGPGRPQGAGRSLDILRACIGRIPVLGVCLGFQCIGAHFGMELTRGRPVHGKTSTLRHDGLGVFAGVRENPVATRYHSLVLAPSSIADPLVATAWTGSAEDSVLMGVRHVDLPVEGVQFHPESFLTEDGSQMLGNFLSW